MPEGVGAGREGSRRLCHADPGEREPCGTAHPFIVQAGSYGEHTFERVTIDGQTSAIGGLRLKVRLEPGCDVLLVFRMARYKNQPALAYPWDRDR
jgi:hypothetical protein